MDGHVINVDRHAKNYDFPKDLVIFYKSVTDRRTDRRTDGLTDQPTDQRTYRRTDIPSYRDAIAASKKAGHDRTEKTMKKFSSRKNRK